jgi:hypothetical protein
MQSFEEKTLNLGLLARLQSWFRTSGQAGRGFRFITSNALKPTLTTFRGSPQPVYYEGKYTSLVG